VARAVAFHAAGDRVAVITADGDVTVWGLPAGGKLASFHAHDGDGYALAFHPTQPVIATGGQDGKLRLWSLTGTPLYEELLGGWVQAVAFAPSGDRLAAVTRTMPPHLMIYALSTP
jgi:WD40 repeat protein